MCRYTLLLMSDEKELKEEQLVARVSKYEKQKLLNLAKAKGCEGWTAFVRMLAYAKEIIIKS